MSGKKSKQKFMSRLNLSFSRRQLIIMTIATVLVVGTIVTAATILIIQSQTAQQSTDTTTETNTTDVDRQERLSQKVDESDKKALSGDIDGAVAVYDEAIETASDDSEKADYQGAKAVLLLNNDSLDKALEEAVASFNNKQTHQAAAMVADIAKEKGDNAMAIEYYQKARDLVDESDVMGPSNKSRYIYLIQELGGE